MCRKIRLVLFRLYGLHGFGRRTIQDFGGNPFDDSLGWQFKNTFKAAILFQFECLGPTGQGRHPRLAILHPGKTQLQLSAELCRIVAGPNPEHLPFYFVPVTNLDRQATYGNSADTRGRYQYFKAT